MAELEKLPTIVRFALPDGGLLVEIDRRAAATFGAQEALVEKGGRLQKVV